MPEIRPGPRRYPSRDLLEAAEFASDAGCRFVPTGLAALHWNLTPHTLEVCRSLGGGPVFYRFGRWVRYAIQDPSPDARQGLVRLIPAGAAARYLGVTVHSLKLHRRADTGPAYYKFGVWVRYAAIDLDDWADSCRWLTTTTPRQPKQQTLARA
jgi:hypothetical protein